jgi:hypothetical protein
MDLDPDDLHDVAPADFGIYHAKTALAPSTLCALVTALHSALIF